MKKSGIALCAVLPLLWASVAFAQPAAPGDGQPPMPGHHPADMAQMHKHMCTERLADTAAHLSYVQTMLALTDSQQSAWTKYRQAVLDQAGKARSACLEMEPKQGQHPTALDQQAHVEKMLSQELQAIQATRPALDALYQGLTAEQRTTFDRIGLRHGHPGHHGPRGGHWPHPPMEGMKDSPMNGPQEPPPAQ